MRIVCMTFVIVPLLLVAIFGCISSALPSSDADAVYRLLSQYGSRANFPDIDLSNFLEEQRSMKRGLGPRPLRFG